MDEQGRGGISKIAILGWPQTYWKIDAKWVFVMTNRLALGGPRRACEALAGSSGIASRGRPRWVSEDSRAGQSGLARKMKFSEGNPSSREQAKVSL
jgi:hypothetical protein